MAKPGVMIYFDIAPALRLLSDSEKGRLLDAVLSYGASGTIPVFEGMLAMAWEFIKLKIDRDDTAYNNSIAQKQYANFCKKRATLNLSKVPFEDWQSASEDERRQMLIATSERLQTEPAGYDCSPTTATTGSSSSSSTAIVTPSLSAAVATTPTPASDEADYVGYDCYDDNMPANGISQYQYVGGTLGQGVVLLTDEQIEDLLDKLGLDAYDHYVRRLSEFILNRNASVKNHYATILKWAKEDSIPQE